MRNRILLGTFAFLCALSLITSVGGAVTVNGVDYVLLARQGMLIQSGATTINGNVGVSNPPNPANANDGRLSIGAHVTINGTAIAHNIILGSFSRTTTCEFDITSGLAPVPPVCDSVGSPVLPIVAAWPPGPLGAVPGDACVSAAANRTVAAGATLALAPGCYKDVRVNGNGTLNLSAGAYTFKTLTMIMGSTLDGGSATVKVQGLTFSESDVTFNDVFLKTPGSTNFTVTEFISIGANNRFTDVVLYAPTAAIHLRTGAQVTNFGAVANFINVQPAQAFNAPKDCGCFEGVEKSGTTVLITDGDQLDKVQKYFLSPTCDLAGAVEVPKVGAGTPSSVTLDISGVPSGTYHVIGQWIAGTFCNDTLVVK